MERDRIAVLTEGRVRELFAACAFHKDHELQYAVMVKGVEGNITFFDSRLLDEYHARIVELLEGLPVQFRSSAGVGGATFQDAFWDSLGGKWASDIGVVDMLFKLGRSVELLRLVWPEPDRGLVGREDFVFINPLES